MKKYPPIFAPLMTMEKREDPLIEELLGIIETLNGYVRAQEGQKEELLAEIKRIKGLNQRPKISASTLGQPQKPNKKRNQKRAGSAKKPKTQNLIIHEEKTIAAIDVPDGARFKGYAPFVVQELIIKAKNTKYLLEKWQLPSGEYIQAKLPDNVANHHFGPQLRSYILHQCYHQGVTQPLLLEQLHEWGIDISKGGLNNILTTGQESYHAEKEALLEVGLRDSSYIQTDDTGARHKGKNYYCTVITNPFFTYFRTNKRKNRINFLEILSGGKSLYVVNDAAIEYMRNKGLARVTIQTLLDGPREFKDINAWERYLNYFKIPITERERLLLTEGVMYGGVASSGFFANTPIISDEAGQFNLFNHGLCWFHAERKIEVLIPSNEQEIKEIDLVKQDFWNIYDELIKYKLKPRKLLAKQIRNFFVVMCKRNVFAALRKVLKSFLRKQEELLLVLKYPDIPLHNNLSERDIREYVKKRKISGSTRSEDGRMCRDSFASLKKTCKKLGLTFWKYLLDRESNLGQIRRLPDILKDALGAKNIYLNMQVA